MNILTEWITWISASLIFLSPFYLKKHFSTNATGNIAVARGILGTFVGVFIGLLGFDVNDISQSVPILLEGLKTAFATSIAGMSASLVLKLRPSFYHIQIQDSIENRDESVADKMIGVLQNIEKGIANVERSIAGENETTMLTQIQKLRTSTSDGLSQLNSSFREFADKMVENNTQALIDALTKVMQDFNAKINEQFGENFKRLNEAVGKMVDWQQEYSARVEQMTAQFQRALVGIEACERTLESLTQKASIYQTTSERLETILANLNTNVGSFSELAKNAQSALPIIEKELRDMTVGFSDAVQTALRENNRMYQSQKEGIDQQINTFSRAYQSLGEQLQRLSNDTNRNIERMVKENSDRITEQLTKIDQELGNELNKALSSLGSQLTSLSRQFVNDYTPLTQELQRLVQMTNRN
jgi:DNA anti-recombination protein RmuC